MKRGEWKWREEVDETEEEKKKKKKTRYPDRLPTLQLGTLGCDILPDSYLGLQILAGGYNIRARKKLAGNLAATQGALEILRFGGRKEGTEKKGWWGII